MNSRSATAITSSVLVVRWTTTLSMMACVNSGVARPRTWITSDATSTSRHTLRWRRISVRNQPKPNGRPRGDSCGLSLRFVSRRGVFVGGSDGRQQGAPQGTLEGLARRHFAHGAARPEVQHAIAVGPGDEHGQRRRCRVALGSRHEADDRHLQEVEATAGAGRGAQIDSQCSRSRPQGQVRSRRRKLLLDQCRIEEDAVVLAETAQQPRELAFRQCHGFLHPRRIRCFERPMKSHSTHPEVRPGRGGARDPGCLRNRVDEIMIPVLGPPTRWVLQSPTAITNHVCRNCRNRSAGTSGPGGLRSGDECAIKLPRGREACQPGPLFDGIHGASTPWQAAWPSFIPPSHRPPKLPRIIGGHPT